MDDAEGEEIRGIIQNTVNRRSCRVNRGSPTDVLDCEYETEMKRWKVTL